MRKITLIIAVLVGMIFAQANVTIGGEGCNVRDIPYPFSKSQVVGVAYPGTDWEVVDKFSSYIKVKVGDGSSHEGKTGWIWSFQLGWSKGADIGIYNPSIGDVIEWSGGHLRSAPFKAKKTEYVKCRKCTVTILDVKVTKYKITNGKITGWIGVDYIVK